MVGITSLSNNLNWWISTHPITRSIANSCVENLTDSYSDTNGPQMAKCSCLTNWSYSSPMANSCSKGSEWSAYSSICPQIFLHSFHLSHFSILYSTWTSFLYLKKDTPVYWKLFSNIYFTFTCKFYLSCPTLCTISTFTKLLLPPTGPRKAKLSL